MNRWKKSRDNRGMSLVMVIGTVALVSILVVIVLSLSLMNIQMKSVYKKSADNFYDAEAAMDEIRTGLQQDVADAATTAYLSVMSQYSASSYQDAVRQSTFRELYRKELKKKIGQTMDDTHYDIGYLENYIGASHRYEAATGTGARLTTQDGKDADLVVTQSGLVIMNLELSYKDADAYESVVDTDLVLSYPQVNFIQSTSVPDLLNYCVVADEGVWVNNGNRTLTMNGNVYAGDYYTGSSSDRNGFHIDNSGSVMLGLRKTLITRGGLTVENKGSFTTDTKATIWADNLNVYSNAALSLSGSTYVSDDLTITGSGDVTLRGEYYGYGNPETAKAAASVVTEEVNANKAAYSSAMIINGIADSGKASIRMNGLKTLMLAGNAYIGSGNAMMGESLAVKSSQTAYLAPADSFLINTTNPTTVAEDFMAKSDFAATPEKYINYEVLKNYHAFDITPLYKDGLVYYFLKFENAKEAAAFDLAYYNDADHAATRQQYLSLYVDDAELSIRESSSVEKITNGSILVWDTKGIRTIEPTTISNGLDDIYEDGYYAGLQSGWQDMYASYNISLTKDYERLTTEQKAATVFENLVDVDGLKKITGTSGAVEFEFTDGDGIRQVAYVTDNEGASALEVDASFLGGKNVPLIIATGDVKVTADYTGTILSGGQVTFGMPGSSSSTVSSDMQDAARVIQNAEYKKGSDTYILSQVLKNSQYYVGSIGKAYTGEDAVDVTKLVTYQNWSKE